MRVDCTHRVVTLRDEREAEEEMNQAWRRERREERDRERDLEDQIGGVTWSE
jgi:hypothetical protein